MLSIVSGKKTVATNSAKQIILISLTSLIFGHFMITKYIPNEALNVLALIIISYFIFYHTLRKNDLFSFIMVMYFCCTPPFLNSKGGGFNMVSFTCVIMYILINKKLPTEKKLKDTLFYILIAFFVLSSILGWLLNFTGSNSDLIYSLITFFGLVFLLLISSRLEITFSRIKIFLQINFFLIIYATIASINKYFHIININTFIMPIYGESDSYFEGGGLIGSSPLYGENSMILLLLFFVFILSINLTNIFNKVTLYFFATLAFVNVFMSISRSVFLLSIMGVLISVMFQYKLIKIKIERIILLIIALLIISVSVITIVNYGGLSYVFNRVSEIENRNKLSGGLSLERIINGSAFNREDAFREARYRFESKDSWLIGYGWGMPNNNRDAFYVDTTISRGSAHSQIFAMLFIFGWIGFVAYFGLIFRIIYKSYKTLKNINSNNISKIMAYFFMIAFILFFLNEIKADSVSMPSYFGVTIIWMGLTYSVNNMYDSKKQKKKNKRFIL